jgi:mRNA interferase RelE/StbE
MRQVNLSRDAARSLRRTPPKHQRQLAAKLLQLADDPRPADSIKLTDSVFYRVNVGDYRIVYEFDHDTVAVALIEQRDQVYRRLKRR